MNLIFIVSFLHKEDVLLSELTSSAVLHGANDVVCLLVMCVWFPLFAALCWSLPAVISSSNRTSVCVDQIYLYDLPLKVNIPSYDLFLN